ncbi:UDP-N-acetylmuramate--L-alanine ligase [Candidatus Kuenenbacteria bacterium HGW-Kuenenbacteria-1]|uniref:UDP-N-acetylmuramate--L-alanine ligase n=1 Tax=Candidatus Kuenenbacteria bacterium HGW-Kuenenbacteria-1 TaxID=2013812 RepID=A0A2N1UN93_9BACT|nr:MAG: UDP-N-acetylmuramate--L-alanine ligase [Candidatus Kuenenbacteria bacterium HGW-Kuenenbacteria-1]
MLDFHLVKLFFIYLIFNKDMANFKKVHIIGIGGIGVSAIAKMMLKLGKTVTGSDVNSSEIIQALKSRGVLIYQNHKKENLSSDTDLVIYSSAVPENNPERIQAQIFNIPQLSYPEFLGELSKKKYTIAISGTNGKSTTTSILGLILEKANFDPLVIVGSKVNQSTWEENLRIGKSNYFVVEACEWQANMLNLHPQIIILTNIQEDHLDYYLDINHIIETFQKYVEKLPDNGILIANSDDENIQLLLKKIKNKNFKIITFGQKQGVDFQIKNIIKTFGLINFTIQNNKIKKEFTLQIPGLFNIYNAVGASVMAFELKVPLNIIRDVVANFKGIWRRFEKQGEKNGAIIISDYAHTPIAIRGTIQAAKDFYPNRRIVVAFQPHHRDRTRKLFNEFIESFDQVDLLILPEIFDVQGREDKKDKDISSKDLIKEIKKRHNFKNKLVLYAKDLEETKKLILKNLKSNDLILLIGAGDIYKIKL